MQIYCLFKIENIFDIRKKLFLLVFYFFNLNLKQKQNTAQQKREKHRYERPSTFDLKELDFGEREKVFLEFQKFSFKCGVNLERLRNTVYIIKKGKLSMRIFQTKRKYGFIRVGGSLIVPGPAASASPGNIRNSSYQAAVWTSQKLWN